VQPVGFDWGVPGLRQELVTELIRTLPKRLRRSLVPVPETAAGFVATADPASGPLLDALERDLGTRTDEPIGRGDWDLDRLPPHLRVAFLVEGTDGEVLAQGRDLAAIQADLAGQARGAIAEAGAAIERRGLVDWSLGRLPAEVELHSAGTTVIGYPAL